MTDQRALKAKFVAQGMNLQGVAKSIGISRNTLYQKISNKREFNASEICKLAELLHLSSDEVVLIFLTAA